jgi:uncharacterized protein
VSEFLVNQKQETLKGIIKDLHDGATVDEVKKSFDQLIRNVSPEEIASMEQALIDEGFPVAEVQRLCDVHVEVFESSLKKYKSPRFMPGHPVHTFKLENREVKQKLKQLQKSIRKLSGKNPDEKREQLKTVLQDLKLYDLHFQRKENQLFPVLERHDFVGPSKVMWGKHDEIRAAWKDLGSSLEVGSRAELMKQYKDLSSRIRKMILMEEKILFPTALKKLSEADWARIRSGEHEIGYAWVKSGDVWDAGLVLARSSQDAFVSLDTINLERKERTMDIPLKVGALSPEQINLLLLNLPVDITFVDEHDNVRYYTGSEHRVFPRSPEIIGRAVQNCHPPKSVGVVEKILESFRKREQDTAEFWIQMDEMFVHIRYFALYDEGGSYKGCIEVSQDVAGIRALAGERRLLDW